MGALRISRLGKIRRLPPRTMTVAQLAVMMRRIADARQRWDTEIAVLRTESGAEVRVRVGDWGMRARAWSHDDMTGPRLEWLGWLRVPEERPRPHYEHEWSSDVPTDVFVKDLLRAIVAACLTHEGEPITFHPWSLSDDGWAGWRWSERRR